MTLAADMLALVPVLHSAAELLPLAMDTPEARVMLLTIAGQESGCTARCQAGNGPARGLWQFERAGGAKGVLNHDASRYWAHQVCAARGVPPIDGQVWAKLETDDVLAAAFSRLLLFTDPRRLPALGSENAAWDTYQRNWRPGKPHPDRWPPTTAPRSPSSPRPTHEAHRQLAHRVALHHRAARRVDGDVGTAAA